MHDSDGRVAGVQILVNLFGSISLKIIPWVNCYNMFFVPFSCFTEFWLYRQLIVAKVETCLFCKYLKITNSKMSALHERCVVDIFLYVASYFFPRKCFLLTYLLITINYHTKEQRENKIYLE